MEIIIEYVYDLTKSRLWRIKFVVQIYTYCVSFSSWHVRIINLNALITKYTDNMLYTNMLIQLISL